MKLVKITFILAMTVVLMVSCLKDSDSNVTLYDDAAIIDLTLGTMNRYVDGVKSTYAGSSYLFNIDQMVRSHTFKDTTVVSRSVYNTDSLLLGTDLQHVLVSVSTLNNGIAVIQRLDDPTYFDYLSSTDSIDFTKPRLVRVFSSSGLVYNDYYVSVEAHQEDGNAFVWKQMASDWTPDPVEETNLPAGIKQLLGSSTTEQYALSVDNKLMVSKDKGATWQEEVITDDADKLPVRDLTLISYPLVNTDSVDCVLLAGNREVNEQNSEGIAMVWHKVVDYGRNAAQATWSYMERNAADGDSLSLPRLKNLRMVKYGSDLLAIGGEGLGSNTQAAYTKMYQSRDNGITWKLNSSYTMPSGFDNSATNVRVTVDDDNFIWLYCEGTGQVWRGRLNRLGWKIQE